MCSTVKALNMQIDVEHAICEMKFVFCAEKRFLEQTKTKEKYIRTNIVCMAKYLVNIYMLLKVF